MRPWGDLPIPEIPAAGCCLGLPWASRMHLGRGHRGARSPRGDGLAAFAAGRDAVHPRADRRCSTGSRPSCADLAETDPLTGLINHRGFQQALRSELERAAARRESVALVALDLDDFKTINERHGHPFGDGVLEGVGARASQVGARRRHRRPHGRRGIRADPAGHRSGEGPGDRRARPDRGRPPLARRIRAELLRRRRRLPGRRRQRRRPAPARRGGPLLGEAVGKSRTRRFDPDHVRLSGDAPQRSEIERILDERAIEPLYQPVASLTTGRLIGYEALARFPDAPERPPSTWFAQANACGLGPELEAAAIRAALEPIGRPPGTHIAVNVSPSALSTEP